MKTRCLNPAVRVYPIYGGRGITVCPEWRDSFETFLRDMGLCPSGLTLDRIDSNGPYAPANCRWATATEQARNRSAVKLTMERAEAMRAQHAAGESRAELARRYGLHVTTVRDVIHRRTWR